MTITLDSLLREYGFEPEDFPQALRTHSALARYAHELPPETRTEFLGALREFFQAYQSLNALQREEMLEQFNTALEEEFELKRRSDH